MKTSIIIHCSATPPSMDIGEEEITSWHTSQPPKGNGWAANGYQYIIRRDGAIELGRDLDKDGDVCEEVGAHAAGFNRESIGICLVGGVDGHNRPENNFTDDQFRSLAWLLGEITANLPTITKICGHRDLPGVKKACPSFDVGAWLRTLPTGHLGNVEV